MPIGDHRRYVDFGEDPNVNHRSFVRISEINNRFEVLERRIADVSNDLDVIKAFVVKSFESFNNNFEEIRKGMECQRPQNQEVILLCTCVYLCVLIFTLSKHILVFYIFHAC